MAATPYRPVSWSDTSLTKEKLQQMANNDQWLFENSPRIRYNYNGLVRDSGLKIIAGKASYPKGSLDWATVWVYFGSFFSASCKPIVTATVESITNGRVDLTIWGIGRSSEIDYRGFEAHCYTQQPANWQTTTMDGGWVNWIAVGF